MEFTSEYPIASLARRNIAGLKIVRYFIYVFGMIGPTMPDGTLCHTFKEAACHRGLLEDDNEYDLCLAMAASWNMPPQLRNLFVTIFAL